MYTIYFFQFGSMNYCPGCQKFFKRWETVHQHVLNAPCFIPEGENEPCKVCGDPLCRIPYQSNSDLWQHFLECYPVLCKQREHKKQRNGSPWTGSHKKPRTSSHTRGRNKQRQESQRDNTSTSQDQNQTDQSAHLENRTIDQSAHLENKTMDQTVHLEGGTIDQSSHLINRTMDQSACSVDSTSVKKKPVVREVQAHSCPVCNKRMSYKGKVSHHYKRGPCLKDKHQICVFCKDKDCKVNYNLKFIGKLKIHVYGSMYT